MTVAAIIVFGSWWAFMLFWGAMAVRTKKTIHKQPAQRDAALSVGRC